MPCPLVSVLTTDYNSEKHLAAAIESVLAQTMEDFELIVVDDCSTDRSVEIARLYENDPRVRIFINEENLGDYPNRKRAAFYASGKYIKYVDADDIHLSSLFRANGWANGTVPWSRLRAFTRASDLLGLSSSRFTYANFCCTKLS